MKLEGSRVWLTGASSGIGAALAMALGRRGCRLALFARSAERLEAVSREILAGGTPASGSASGEILLQPGDVTDRQRVHDAVREAEAAFG